MRRIILGFLAGLVALAVAIGVSGIGPDTPFAQTAGGATT